MADFVEAALVDELPPGTSMVAKIAGKDVALFNVDGTIYAINDICAHDGSSLAAGELIGKIVRCRSHDWQYDVTTGELITAPGYGVASFEVKIVVGKIMVAIDETPKSRR